MRTTLRRWLSIGFGLFFLFLAVRLISNAKYIVAGILLLPGAGLLPKGRSYKPTVQLFALTRQLDFSILRAAGVACFGSLERGLHFLSDHSAQAGRVYPLE